MGEFEPENEIEIKLLKMVDEQDTFLFHYQNALELRISPYVTFISIVDDYSRDCIL